MRNLATRKKISRFLFAILAVYLTTSFASIKPKYPTVYDYIDQQTQTQIFSDLLKAGLFDKTLQTKGPFTVFAFTDEVIRKLPKNVQKNLRTRQFEHWTGRIISNHIFEEYINIPYDRFPKTVTSVSGNQITILNENEEITINNARVIEEPIITGNGVVMLVDAIIIP